MNRAGRAMEDTHKGRQKLPEVGERGRFVVLHHTGGAGADHFDLMLEAAGEEKLMCWRVGVGPERWGDGLVWDAAGVERIADHRAVYMTYEGQISGGRGAVKRVAEGAGGEVALPYC